jgi:hypothetical protein
MTTVEFVQFLLLLAFGTAVWRLIAHWLKDTSFGPAVAFVTP